MTLHIAYDHECPDCAASYIPYDEDVPCPRCGLLEDRRFDFIPKAVASLDANRRVWGQFTPIGWWVGRLGDRIIQLLFKLLDAYGAQDEKPPFELFAAKCLAATGFGDEGYLREHVLAIAVRVREELPLVGAA